MIAVEELGAAYGAHTVLDGLSFEVAAGRVCSVIGRNGCGKSTLVSCIMRAMKYRGRIRAAGRDIAALSPRARARLVSVLPQMISSPQMTVYELISLGRSPYVGLTQRFSPRDDAAISRAARLTETEELLGLRADRISGGELQRAYLALALAQETKVIVLDELAAHMDIARRRETLCLIRSLARNHGISALIVLHDINLALRYSDDVLVIDGGCARYFGPADKCAEAGVIEEVFGAIRADGAMYI